MIWSPAPYPWPDGRRAAACFSVDVDALSPYLWATRDARPDTIAVPEHRMAGMRRGLSRMTDMLARLDVRGSFFVPAVVARENPGLLPGLVERGHEVALHGDWHEQVGDISDQQFTDALEASVEVFVAQTGQRPTGFRSPAWEMTPHMLRELRRLDLWDSSLMGDDVPYDIEGVTELPVRWDIDDAIFFKFLGAGDRAPRSHLEIGEGWSSELSSARRHGTLFMMTVHDWICGRPARIDMLEDLWREIVDSPDIWVATCGDLARHHRGLTERPRHALTQLPVHSSKGSSDD
ncbi:polysaccharide deacetylase family protein [Paracoccus sp. 1_MG-2023]|uniref:polysaccharide deacetylase family protein n=1 Tax=unclassified Paracoccus (in: a-proteobacteria) TaxID=2688777 RepID=UPI001C092A36|nr:MULTISPECIES: polysaccharide deacetylase family protein [unclassified Paracoccus (in: a-proteobacteria)]MBU2957941.1 polysaccharide deacetylase family protein [Paracoccus sp. C2R09]MDO6668865.1 polysaccharide deacetylase family protein [Paracoccus sp. 1_MG-2023]